MRYLPALSAIYMHLLVASAVKIMPLGDSITEWSCWRAMLQTAIRNTVSTQIDFVGSLTSTGICSQYANFDPNHEGHSGYQAVNIASQNQLVGWLQTAKPDIVLMHLGTNDVWNGRTISEIMTSFGTLVEQMRASKADMKILVAKIIPMNPPDCPSCYQKAQELNTAIASWVPQKSTKISPITLVDQNTGFDTSTDTNDGVHPNTAGDLKIAQKWEAPLKAALASTPTPTSTSVITTPTEVPAAIPAWGQCGGVNWAGATNCVSGYTCKQLNPYYSQCTP